MRDINPKLTTPDRKGFVFIGFVKTEDIKNVEKVLKRHSIEYIVAPDKFHTDGSQKDWFELYVLKKAKRESINILKVHFASSRKRESEDVE